ncbi:hypothetical protein TOPH_08921 [Tolypocladium ophioglossoides CBS 100239]|uniref:Peroxin 20 n=1 Tax=Tolypocladium ophioglossoides (strain CBS 100239) TaxID=1163406 RepID=A0A0L0MXE5_TOLOC|nr:hypothetical protein TOPH_08921 [Tolypocladium ophioglossoides CBS 100239]
MADASCSGASPFKRLVDHQSRDVSHHQDRLVDRAGVNGHGSFRSAPRHPAQGHDSFGAFMDGVPSSATIPGMGPHSPAGRLAVHAAALQPRPEFSPQAARASPVPNVSNWAADFTRFSGSSSQQQMRAPAPAMQMNHHQQPNFQAAFGQSAFTPPMYVQGNAAGFMAPAAPVESDFDQEMARWMSSHGGGNMTDVDAAMEQIARELELNEAALPKASTAATESTAQQTGTRFTDLETPELGNLSLHDPTTHIHTEPLAAQEPLQAPQDEYLDDAAKAKSAVSEAAERLLESVQHEDGEKWQNSVFLSLMRDFRDGRKDIVNNEIRQTEDGGESESLT